MRWPWRAGHRQRDRQTWADLVSAESAAQLAQQMQAEAIRLAVLSEHTVILETGVRLPGYLAATEDWE